MTTYKDLEEKLDAICKVTNRLKHNAGIHDQDETIKELLSGLDSTFLEDRYKDYLDEAYELIEVCGGKYLPSRTLKEVDPIAYRVGESDFQDTIDQDEEFLYDDQIYQVSDVEDLLEEIESISKLSNDQLLQSLGKVDSLDLRFSVLPEFCGHAEAQYVFRFCGKFIDSFATQEEAKKAAHTYFDDR